MKMTLHLFLKDLRATLPWWLLTLALATSLAVIPVTGMAGEDWSWNRLSFWLGWLLCLAVVLLQGRLLSLDPPEGAERFIGTRPVSGWRVVAGKACVLGLLGLLPLLLAFGIRIFRLGMDAGAWRTSGILVQDFCLLLLVIGMLCRPYAGRWHSWTAPAAILMALVIFLLGNGLMFIPFAMDALPIVTFLGAVAIVALAAMLARYGKLSGWAFAGCLVLGALCGGGMSYASFGPMIRPGTPALVSGGELTLEADHAREFINQAARKVSDLALTLHAGNRPMATHVHGGREIEFRQDVLLKGLPEGVYADFDVAKGHYQIAGQGEWRAMREGRAGLGWTILPDAAFHAVPGNPRPTAETVRGGQSIYMPLGRAYVAELSQDQATPIHLKGEATFYLYRVRLEKVLPLVDGAVWASEQLRLTFSQVERSNKKVQFQVVADVLDANGHDRHQSIHDGLFDLGFFGLHDSSGKPARLNCLRGWRETNPLLRHERFLEQVSFSAQDNWWRFPDTKAPELTSSQEGELGIFRREVIATVKVPYEFRNAQLRLR